MGKSRQAEKLPSGRWRIRVYVGKDEAGKKHYKSFTADKESEVKRMANRYLEELEELEAKQNNPAAHMTLDEAMKKCIEYKEQLVKQDAFSPATLSTYQSISRNQFQDIKNCILTDLSNDLIQKSIDKEKLAPKSKHNAIGFLSVTLGMYYPEFVMKVKLPTIPKKKTKLPTQETILKAVKGTNCELPVLLSLCCTLRLSEIKGLRKSDFEVIDNDRAILTVNNTQLDVKGKQIFREGIAKTYTSQGRQITVPSPVWELIKQIPPEQDEIIKECHCTVRKRFYKALENNNIPRIEFHKLRHLSASTMLDNNIPDLYAMERMGHATNSMLKHYQHTFDDTRANIENMLTADFEQLYASV